jgi:iron complex outermembrane recepter protein
MQAKSYSVFVFFWFTAIVFSQNKLSGIITTENQKGLEGCHVHIGNKTVNTNKKGYYEIKDLPSGKCKISLSFVGYQAIDTLVEISRDTQLHFVMKQNAEALYEVLIKQKGNTLSQSVVEQKVKLATIEKFSNQSLGDVLQEVAGVSGLKTGSTVVKPIVNGMFGSRVPIINNNVRMQDQEWGSEHAPNFDVNAAGKISVVKGASGLQYGGDAVGGLVILEPIQVRKDTLFGRTMLNLASNGRGGSVTTSLHKGNDLGWSWNVLGTFKYMGDREAPDYVLSNTGNRESNFTGDVKYTGKRYFLSGFYSYYNATIGILSASHTGSINDLYNSINNQKPSVINDFTYNIDNPKQEVRHHLAKLNYQYYFDETASLSSQYSFQFNKRLEFDVRRGNFNKLAALDLELSTHNLNVDFKKTYHDWHLKSGVNAGFQNNFASPATGIRPLIPNYEKLDAGIYAIASVSLSDDLVVDCGLRYDFSKVDAKKFYFKSRWTERGYDVLFPEFVVREVGDQILAHPNFTFHNLSASLGFRKTFDKQWDWYTNISLATRNPNPSEFFSDGLHHSTGIIELGDLSLQKEESLKFSTSLQKSWRAFSFELNPFVHSVKNYMFLRPVGAETTIRGAFPVWEYQQTKALLGGVDFQTNLEITSQWQHRFSMAYIKGTDLDNDEPLIDMPPFHFVNALEWKKKDGCPLLLSLKSEVVFRQKSFPNNNFTINLIDLNGELQPTILDISTPPPGYHLLHFYSEIQLEWLPKTKTTIAFSVQNIFNTNYRDYLNRQRFFADEVGRNFQIQIKFNY